MELFYFQKGFNYSQDGPGNRLVYHLQGCNMRCIWCSNPEGISENEKCIKASVDEIVEEIISCRPMFFDGGGVTFTGGEATLQLEALTEIMKRVRTEGISVALETNGTHSGFKEVLDYSDYLMIDFKHPNSDIHKKFTGVPNGIIKKNIKTAVQKTAAHIRIPLIHRFNDSVETVEEFICFFKELSSPGGAFDVELLPYHEYGKEKWLKLGLNYEITDGFVSKEFVSFFEDELKNNNIKVIKT